MNREEETMNLRAVIMHKLIGNGFQVEENTYFSPRSYMSIRDKNNPHVRVYLEVPILYPADPPKIITYYEDVQTSYAYSSFEYESLGNVALEHFKNPNKRPVSGAPKPNKNVEENFSKWEYMDKLNQEHKERG